MTRWAALAGVAVCLGLAGCTSGPVDIEALEANHPDLAALGSHRLADANFYLLPVKGRLWLFTCRWPDPAAIPVAMPDDASDAELALLRRALAALEGAVGVRFREDPRATTGVHLSFAKPARGGLVPPTATTLAECALAPEARDASPVVGNVIPARLVLASVVLSRQQPTLIGTKRPHAADELMGSVLHELGHALGFQGHARRGDSVLVRSLDHVRWTGRAVLAGEPLEDQTLRALYALPSGTLVGTIDVGLARTDPIDHLAAVAARLGFRGPAVRVGDEAGQVLWRDGEGVPYGFQVPKIAALRYDASLFELRASDRTKRLLRARP